MWLELSYTMNDSLFLAILVFAFALWLGLYLLAREPHKPVLIYTGLGLAAYALILELSSLIAAAPGPGLALNIQRLRWPLLFAPGLLWFGAAVEILPEQHPLRLKLAHALRYLIPVIMALLYVVSLTTGVQAGSLFYQVLTFGAVALLLVAVVLVATSRRGARPRRLMTALLTVSMFLALSAGLLFFPLLLFIPADWTLFALGIDLLLLGVCIAVLDAFDEGETLLPDLTLSLARTWVVTLVFGGQIVLVMRGSENGRFEFILLLFGVVAAAIATQTLYNPLLAVIDRLVLARFPRARQARTELRAAVEALSRADESLNPLTLDDAAFARLTRRALSSLSDPGKLAASPLTRLPLIDARLKARQVTDGTLERAAELKVLLTESIIRLKPRGPVEFGITDEWRYYNALYIPYVKSIKPYSRAVMEDDLEPELRQVIEWLRASVPERTLHNWQNAAARLVAQDLREQNGSHWQ
jgi:hypothetical protein